MTNQTNAPSPKLVPLLFTALGLFILGAGLLYGYESWQLAQNGFAINGAVVDYLEREDEDQQVQYAPIIAYRVDGQDFRFASDNYANRPAYDIGESIPLLYDLNNPASARINTPLALWGLPAGFVIAGLLLSIASSIGMWRRN